MVSTASSSGAPPRSGRLRPAGPELALAAWTLLVWVGRIRNIVADDELTDTGRGWRLGLAGGMTALALALGITLLLRPVTSRPARTTAMALAVASIVVWIIRGTQIGLGSHDLGFKIVHSVLAVVTIALAAWVIRHLRTVPTAG